MQWRSEDVRGPWTTYSSGPSACVITLFLWSGKIFRGSKVIFLIFFPGVNCFFPVETSHFGRLKTNFSGFWKVKRKKKKKKKKKSPLFIFQLFLLPFSIFHLPFSFFFFLQFPFFLASLFPVGQQKFPGQKCRGALCLPACYATAPHTPLLRLRTSYFLLYDFKYGIFKSVHIWWCILEIWVPLMALWGKWGHLDDAMINGTRW